MSLPIINKSEDIMEHLEREALDNGHDIEEGFVDSDVLGTKFKRMECSKCHEVAYVWPNGSGSLPMNPGQCRGKVKAPDLEKLSD